MSAVVPEHEQQDLWLSEGYTDDAAVSIPLRVDTEPGNDDTQAEILDIREAKKARFAAELASRATYETMIPDETVTGYVGPQANGRFAEPLVWDYSQNKRVPKSSTLSYMD